MSDSAVERFLRNLTAPKTNNQNTAAPGTNSRVDVDTPDQQGTMPNSGKGHPDFLGYGMHGDAIRPASVEVAQRAIEAAHLRYPGLANLGKAGPVVPEYNDFYGQWRTYQGYDKVVSNVASGTLVVPGTLSQAVTLATPANLRLSQYPGAIMVLPVLMLWSWSNSVITATGQYSFSWTPRGADVAFPLGEYYAGAAGDTKDMRMIASAPIIDANQTDLGTITLTTTAVVGTPSINWRMAIGWAYLLPVPAFKGPVPLQVPVAHNGNGG